MNNEQLANMRQDYQKAVLNKQNIHQNPFEQFEQWFEDVQASSIKEPNAMIVATVDAENRPSTRTVLLKGFSDEGFLFYTNYESRKGKQIDLNPQVSILFYWDILERQVRIEGKATKISPEASDAYFNKRPLGSRIGAIASPQSKVIDSRKVLEDKVKVLNRKYAAQTPMRPDNWGGYVVQADYFEFWQGRSSRLHDCICFSWEDKGWKIERLAP